MFSHMLRHKDPTDTMNEFHPTHWHFLSWASFAANNEESSVSCVLVFTRLWIIQRALLTSLDFFNYESSVQTWSVILVLGWNGSGWVGWVRNCL